MKDIGDIIKEIHEAFGNNEYPVDAFLQGSFEGYEPFEEVGPFKGKTDWRTIDPDFLDGHAVREWNINAMLFLLSEFLSISPRLLCLRMSPFVSLSPKLSLSIS